MRWLLGALVLLAVGLVLQLGMLVYAMYVLLGVMLVSRTLTRRWIAGLRATRECSSVQAEIGGKVAIVVTLRNASGLPVPWLLVEDSLPRDALQQRPPRIRVDGRRLTLMQLPRHGQKSLLYQVRFLMRGYYQIGPLLAETGDLFGLHRKYRVLTKPHFVLVLPKIVPLEGYDIASRRPIGEVRIMHRLFEDPTRVSGVRDYRAGDPLNRVHWKATARTGTLQSKTFEPSSIAGATLLLDFHQDGYPARGEPYRSELAVTAAASLANAVYQLGQQIGMISNGRDAADRVRQEGWRHEFQTREAARSNVGMSDCNDRLQPVWIETRRGAAQLTHILELLARLELTDGLTFSQLIAETQSRMPRDATVIAVLTQVPAETAVALGQLRRSGFAVTAIAVLPEETSHTGDAFASRLQLPETLGRLVAEGLNVRYVDNEAGVAHVCSGLQAPGANPFV